MRSSIQVSDKLRRRLARHKRYEREPYEEVVERALDALDRPGPLPRDLRIDAATRRALEAFLPIVRKLYRERLARVVLYGSQARGEATVHSDIDLLVVLRGDVQFSEELHRLVDAHYDIDLEHGVLISAHPISEKDFLTEVSPLLMNVRKESIVLWAAA